MSINKELYTDIKQAFLGKELITDRELRAHFAKTSPSLKPATFRWRIFDLKKRGQIRRVAKGLYALDRLRPFHPIPSKSLARIHNEVRKILPLANACIWETKWLDAFMIQHVSFNMLVLEVEKEAAEYAFSLFRGRTRASFMEPTKTELRRYILAGQETLIVKPLTTRAPLQQLGGITAPKIEKILVDLFCETTLFSAFQGKELESLFENTLRQVAVDFAVLGSYARRRRKEVELRRFLLENVQIPPYIRKALLGRND